MMHQQPITGGSNPQEEEISVTVVTETIHEPTPDKSTKPLTGWGSEQDGVWF